LDTLDYIKAALMVFLLLGAAPIVGFYMRKSQRWQRIFFFALCFTTLGGFFEAREWGFTIYSHLYRGHSRGFHFFFTDFFAASLIFAQMSGQWRRFKFFPPGFWLWMIYCFLSMLSFFNAPSVLYGAMAAFKAIKIIMVLVAGFNFLRSMEEVHFFLTSMSVAIFWELLAVLKLKYIDHIYQVYGTFEHQNSLSMFSILIGMVFLAMALGPRHRKSNLYFSAYVACAAIVQSTLSRGGLAIFGLGTVAVVLLSIIDKPTRRRIVVTASIAAIGIFGLMMTYSTIMARFNDYGNDESKRTREMLNISSRLMLHDFPLGVGWNNFALVINHPYPYADHIDYWNRINGNTVDRSYKKGVVESLYWLMLSETGYQGFASFILFMALFLFLNIRAMLHFRTRPLGALSIGIFLGCTMNYLQSFLERILTQPRNMTLWFLLLALTGKIESWRRQESRLRKAAAEQKRFEPVVSQAEDDQDLEDDEPWQEEEFEQTGQEADEPVNA
jgi:hypothetical protein